jgi:cellulose synthase (UDP-forming)
MTSVPRGHYTCDWQSLRKCPYCHQPTVRTEDWACPWCGNTLTSRYYKKIPKTLDQLKRANWTGTLPEWQSNVIAKFVALITVAYTSYYLIWRLSTFNPDALWFSWLLWLTEGYGLITFILFIIMTWYLVYPRTPAVRNGIMVDVFVPTCGEPIDVLRATLTGCNSIRYPHRTFVLDDSHRPEVQAIATELGCFYISRSTNEAAKAGNLNYALKHTDGDLVAVLDADHIPLPDFLHNTIGYFNDPSVAVVQGPQVFYNLDSFQHDGLSWHEQRLFYDVIMPGKNRTNSAFWTGSPAVLRRSALESVGGVATETVTEDLATTMKFIKHGYHVVYTHRPLASGLAPSTVEGYLGQRFRWGQGSMQVLRGKNSPLWTRGLTFSQRLSFIASTITYFDGLQQLVLLFIPIVTLLSGILPIESLGIPFVARLVPYLLLIFISNKTLGRGVYDFRNTWRYNYLRAFTFVSVLPTFFTGRARPFKVTGLEQKQGKKHASLRMITPHITAMFLCLIAIILGVIHIYQPIWYTQQSQLLLAAIMWTFLNVFLLGIAIGRLFNVTRRARYRFPVVRKIQWRSTKDHNWYSGHTTDLSSGGIGFEYKGNFRLNSGDSVEIAIPIGKGELPVTEERASMSRKSEIVILGHSVGNSSSSIESETRNRVGIVIDNFGSQEDAHIYTHLLNHPGQLLYGDNAFHMKKGQLGPSPNYEHSLVYSTSKNRT